MQPVFGPREFSGNVKMSLVKTLVVCGAHFRGQNFTGSAMAERIPMAASKSCRSMQALAQLLGCYAQGLRESDQAHTVRLRQFRQATVWVLKIRDSEMI
jgi:hypothetical protein